MDNQQRVQSVVTAYQLLETLAARNESVSLTELARALDMTPSRVLRHLATLVDLQLVERAGTEPVYRLGVGLIRLAERASLQHDVARIAYPVLRRLSDRFGQATYLVRRQDIEALVWMSFPGSGVPTLSMPPGMSISLTGSAAGRVLLAFDQMQPADAPLADSASAGFPDPIATRAMLDERLTRIRRDGFDHYGTDQQNAVYSLAAPILDHMGRAVAAIGVLGFSVQYPDHGADLTQALMEGATNLSIGLGFTKS